MSKSPLCKDFLSVRTKPRIKEKSGASNTGQFSEKSEGAKVSNSLMVLGYEKRLTMSNVFLLAPSQRGHVSAKERAKMKVLCYIIKLIIAVLTAYIR